MTTIKKFMLGTLIVIFCLACVVSALVVTNGDVLAHADEELTVWAPQMSEEGWNAHTVKFGSSQYHTHEKGIEIDQAFFDAKLAEQDSGFGVRLQAGSYYLSEDIKCETISGDLHGIFEIAGANGGVYLCLNGHRIIGNTTAHGVFSATGNICALFDCCAGVECELGHKSYYKINDKDNFKFTGGRRYNFNNVSEDDAEGVVYGGLITNCLSGVRLWNTSQHVFTMYGGTVSGNVKGGVNASEYAPKITMYRGAVVGNLNSGDGGGVCCSGRPTDTAAFTMYGGVISDNVGGWGGGVRVYYCAFTMHGGEITNNYGAAGGGVQLTFDSFTMNGGIISGNRSIEQGQLQGFATGSGGGIRASSGTITLNGGTITNNTAGTLGDGISSSIDVTIGGAVNISDNANTNLYLTSGSTFTVSGKLEDEDGNKAHIGLTIVNSNSSGKFTSGYVANGNNDPEKYFFLDSGEQPICIKDGEATIGVAHINTDAWVLDYVGDETSPRTQVLTCDVCAHASDQTRNLELVSITATAQNVYNAKDTSIENIHVTAYFKVESGSDDIIDTVTDVTGYVVGEFANGEYLTVQDNEITISYTIGGVTKDANVAITVNPLPNGVTGDYSRESWHEGKKPNSELLPTTTQDVELTFKYYKDDETCADESEYTLAFDANTPAGTYYVKLIVSDPDYVTMNETIGSFTVTPHNTDGSNYTGEGNYDANGHWLVCNVCNAKLSFAEHESNDGVKTKDASCTEQGEITYSCKVCTEVLEVGYINKLDHTSNNGVVTKEATCTETGVKTFSCTVCSTVLSTETIAKVNHTSNSGVVTTAATCTENGVKTWSCTVCEEILNTETVNALGHDWNDGVVTKEPTETEAGERTFTCGRCQNTRTESIPAKGSTNPGTPSTPGITDDNNPSNGNGKRFPWLLVVLVLALVLIIVFICVIAKRNKDKKERK